MRPLPTPPAPGKPVSATLIRQLIDAIRERTILKGRNITIKRGPNGTIVDTMSAPVPSLPRYWTFSCTEDPKSGERTGGWKNCKIQIGYNCSVEDKGTRGENDPRISGTDLTDDGTYYVEVDTKNETAEVKLSGSSGIPHHDLEHDKVNVYIGKVVDGKQKDGIYCIPVIPKYV